MLITFPLNRCSVRGSASEWCNLASSMMRDPQHRIMCIFMCIFIFFLIFVCIFILICICIVSLILIVIIGVLLQELRQHGTMAIIIVECTSAIKQSLKSSKTQLWMESRRAEIEMVAPAMISRRLHRTASIWKASNSRCTRCTLVVRTWNVMLWHSFHYPSLIFSAFGENRWQIDIQIHGRQLLDFF